MASVRVLLLRAAGINCEEETAYAWRLAGASTEIFHVKELIAEPARLERCQVVVAPGGFSYGDDIASGRILAHQLSRHLGDAMRRFVDRGGLLLGICNGFQALVKAGLLPGGAFAGRVTLALNDSARYEDRWVHVTSGGRASPFLRPGQTLRLPVAHGEGKVVTDSPETLAALAAQGHVVLTYGDASGRPGPYPINPNGSEGNIAGLIDATGRILGLMPHPERAVDPTHLPDATRRAVRGRTGGAAVCDLPEGPGMAIFRNAVAALTED